MVTIKQSDLEKGVVNNLLLNATPTNNLLLNSYFENPTIGLHALYVLNMYTNFNANWMQFTI